MVYYKYINMDLKQVDVKTSKKSNLEVLDETDLHLDNETISGKIKMKNLNSDDRIFMRYTVYNEDGYIVFEDIQKIQFDSSNVYESKVIIHPDIRTNKQNLTLKLQREN